MNMHDDDDGEMLPEYDFSRARRASGPRFPEGFQISIDGAIEYSLRLTPSDKIVGRFASTLDAWPAILAEVARGIPARCLVLDWHRGDGTRGRVSSGHQLVLTARSGLGRDAHNRPIRAAS